MWFSVNSEHFRLLFLSTASEWHSGSADYCPWVEYPTNVLRILADGCNITRRSENGMTLSVSSCFSYLHSMSLSPHVSSNIYISEPTWEHRMPCEWLMGVLRRLAYECKLKCKRSRLLRRVAPLHVFNNACLYTQSTTYANSTSNPHGAAPHPSPKRPTQPSK